MIPLHKLTCLPRQLRNRKAAKVFAEAEHRFFLSGQLNNCEADYLGDVTGLLTQDRSFSPQVLAALENARVDLKNAVKKEAGEIRRALNTVYQLLLSETGRNQADWDFLAPSGALDPLKRRSFKGMQVYLEDIRSPFNVGSMFRSAESFGAEKIWLSPLCADPRHKRAERSAMGCIAVLPWERLSGDPFDELNSEEARPFTGIPCFTLETHGTPIEDFSFPAMGILVAGSEELGVSPPALAAADASLGKVSIPTYGAKASLNVSVAFGIVMQAWAAKLTNGCL